MINPEHREALEQASRWIDETQSHLPILRAIINDHSRMRERAEAAERENERLQGLSYENEQLRNRLETSDHERERFAEEVSRLRNAVERHQRERQEIAASLTTFIDEALVRLRGQQQEAAHHQATGG